MELVITSSHLKPEPKRRLKTQFVRPEGLLNSNYKSIVNGNFKNANSSSIFGIKQSLKGRQYQFTSSIDTLLKLSVFAIVLAFVI